MTEADVEHFWRLLGARPGDDCLSAGEQERRELARARGYAGHAEQDENGEAYRAEVSGP